jgi:hypothetical protein
LLVERLDRRLRLGVVWHFNEPEAARTARFPIGYDLSPSDSAELSEHRRQIFIRRRPRQIPDIDICGHRT